MKISSEFYLFSFVEDTKISEDQSPYRLEQKKMPLNNYDKLNVDWSMIKKMFRYRIKLHSFCFDIDSGGRLNSFALI